MRNRENSMRHKFFGVAIVVLAGTVAPPRGPEPCVAQEVSAPKTDLELTVSDVPWNDSFKPGVGIDAATGKSAVGTAVQPFTATGTRLATIKETVSYITDTNTLKREIEASVSGKANFNMYANVEVNGKLEYLSKLDASRNSTTMIAKCVKTFEYEDADSYELTQQAARTMTENPAAFRATYGDYFVAGVKRGGQFVAVYHLLSSNKEDLDRFKSELGVKANVPETDIKGSGKVSGRFEEVAKTNHIQYKIEVYMDGVEDRSVSPEQSSEQKSSDGLDWTPEKVMKELEEFKRAARGKPFMAKLQHYKTLAPNYSNTIAVQPSAFRELNRLYGMLWEVRALFNSLPGNATSALATEKVDFDNAVTTNRTSLVTDYEQRRIQTEKGQNLVDRLVSIAARRAFFEEVQIARQGEKPEGWGLGQKEGVHLLEFGYTPDKPYWAQLLRDSGGAVVITPQVLDYRPDYRPFKRWETTLAVNDPSKLIVGVTVRRNWGDGTGGECWRDMPERILLGTRGAVHVKGLPERGTSWTVTYYTVKSEDYPFHAREK
jgi:hypothetical protein